MPEAVIGPQRAVVVAVDDPEERGRYRVRVFAVHDDAIPIVNLPWAELLCHAGKDWGNVPHYEVDDLIFVLFEGGDREHPVIMGGWLTAPGGVSTLPSEQTGDYSTDRRRWVWKDRAGNLVEVSEKAGEQHVKLKSGEAEVIVSQKDNSFVVTASGPATIDVQGDAVVKSAGKVDIDAGGDVKVVAVGDVLLGAGPHWPVLTGTTGGTHPLDSFTGAPITGVPKVKAG